MAGGPGLPGTLARPLRQAQDRLDTNGGSGWVARKTGGSEMSPLWKRRIAGRAWLLHRVVPFDRLRAGSTGLRGTPARPFRQAQDRLDTNGMRKE